MKYCGKRLFTLLLCLIMVFTNTMFARANESDLELSEADRAILVSQMEQLGIEENAWEGLIQKIIHGEVLDCYNPEQEQNKTSVVIEKPDGTMIRRDIYSDGSVIETRFTPGEEICISPQDISGGEYGSGSGYYYMNGAQITLSSIFIELSFKADYEGTSNNTCKIKKIYDEYIAAITAIYSNKVFEIEKATGTKSDPATAVLSCTYTVRGSLLCTVARLRLIVSPNGAHTTEEFC